MTPRPTRAARARPFLALVLATLGTLSALPAAAAPKAASGPAAKGARAAKPASAADAAASSASGWRVQIDTVSAIALWAVKEPPEGQGVAVQRCVAAAVDFNFKLGVMAFREVPDETVRAKLLPEGLPAADRRLREREYAAWHATHRVGSVTALQFADCLEGLPAEVERATTLCFELLMPSVAAEIQKSQGAAEDASASDLVRRFGSQVNPEFLKMSVHNVYVGDRERDRYRAHRVNFAACLLRSRPEAASAPAGSSSPATGAAAASAPDAGSR